MFDYWKAKCIDADSHQNPSWLIKIRLDWLSRFLLHSLHIVVLVVIHNQGDNQLLVSIMLGFSTVVSTG